MVSLAGKQCSREDIREAWKQGASRPETGKLLFLWVDPGVIKYVFESFCDRAVGCTHPTQRVRNLGGA